MPPPTSPEPLRRQLGVLQSASLIVGISIGSGIFVGSDRTAAFADASWQVLAVWIAAGLLSLLGAMIYAEFGATFPASGGDYVYLRESVSPLAGFLSGWLTFISSAPAGIAAIAIAAASQVEAFKPPDHLVAVHPEFAVRVTALGLVVAFGILNYFGLRGGALVQVGLTSLKLGLIVVLLVVGLANGEVGTLFARAPPGAVEGILGIALIGALWAYDGWSIVSRVAGEVKEPARTIPRALILGTLVVLVVYVGMNLAYLSVLGVEGMAGAGLDEAARIVVASRFAEAVMGPVGTTVVSAALLLSLLAALNGSLLSSPRVYYAMSKDRLFPQTLSAVHPVHRTPHHALLLETAMAGAFAALFSFESLTAYIVIISWLKYGLAGWGLLRLRRSRPNLERPFRLRAVRPICYTFLALAAVAIALMLTTVVADATRAAVFGLNLLLVASGVPVYLFYRRRLAAHEAGGGRGRDGAPVEREGPGAPTGIQQGGLGERP